MADPVNARGVIDVERHCRKIANYSTGKAEDGRKPQGNALFAWQQTPRDGTYDQAGHEANYDCDYITHYCPSISRERHAASEGRTRRQRHQDCWIKSKTAYRRPAGHAFTVTWRREHPR